MQVDVVSTEVQEAILICRSVMNWLEDNYSLGTSSALPYSICSSIKCWFLCVFVFSSFHINSVERKICKPALICLIFDIVLSERYFFLLDVSIST